MDVAPKNTPLCNAWLTLINGLSINADRHGDITGIVQEIVA